MALGKGFKTDQIIHDKKRLLNAPKNHHKFTTNQGCLVTGGGTGIRKAAAKALLKGSYQVVLTGRSLEKLEKVITEIGGTQDNCLAVSCAVDHLGEAVLHMAQLPLESNILSMKIMATNMPFVGRG